MLANRLVLVVAALVLPVHGQDVETSIVPKEDVTIVDQTIIDDRPQKDGNAGENRQGRMALHTEAPSSKAKREQALRNILAARRRRILGSKVSEGAKSPSPKTPRTVSKDSPDMLEAQETRHGVYVTAPIGEQVSVMMDNDEEDPLELLDRENLTSSMSGASEGNNENSKYLDDSMTKSLLIRINETDSWILSEKTTNETAASKNTSVILPRLQKILDNDNRRKNIVAMPESLYNHFRPVESNIPVEDMTQFLYFGQKIHPDVQNSSSRSNNSLIDATSTSSSVQSFRRRYSMKRFSTTTPIPVPRLEDMMNEEMNIAVERSTVERNKIPKTKNVFRSPGSGTYFRKPSSVRSTDPTIVSNVILTRETVRNSSGLSDNRRESVLLRNSGKFAGNSSAHAHLGQVVTVSDEGSDGASFDSIVVENVTTGNYSTQFLVDVAKKEENQQQRVKDPSGGAINDDWKKSGDDKTNREQFDTTTETIEESVSQSSIETDSTNMEMASTSRNELINRITTWQSVDSNHEPKYFLADIETSNDAGMTSSTMNDLTGQSDTKVLSGVPTTTMNLASSSLRIVVTEPMHYAFSAERLPTRDEEIKSAGSDGQERVIQEEANVYRRKNQTADEDYASKKFASATTVAFPAIDSSDESPQYPRLVSSSLPTTTTHHRRNPSLPPVDAAETATTRKSEYKQQHAYAYEITNVTRLLRNYTGPGLNVAVDQQVKEDKRRKESGQAEQVVEKEEEKRKKTNNKKEKKLEDERAQEKEKDETLEEGEGGRGKEVEKGPALTRSSAGSIPEIRNVGESVQPTPQRQPLPLLLLLPTPRGEASSSNSGGKVEPARTTGQLSAGTDVGEVTAGSSSSRVDVGVGDRGSGGGAGAGAGDSGGVVGGGSDIETSNTLPPSFSTFATSELARDSSEEHASATSISKESRKVSRDEVTQGAIVASTLGSNRTVNDKLLENPEVIGNDRRYLRKSASALLDRKILEEGLVKEVKRRRGSSSLFSLPANSRRIKGWRNGASDEDPRSSVPRSMENRTASPDRENALSEGTEKISRVSESTGEAQTEVRIDRTTETKIIEEGTTVMPPSTLESPLEKTSDITAPDSDGPNNPSESVITNNGSTAHSSSSTTPESVDSTRPTEATTTTSAPPRFPVTPRMLQEPNEGTNKDKVPAVVGRKSEVNGPFGLGKNLDPSEIQKMYRSQTTLKPESIVTTTTIPDSEPTTEEYPESMIEQHSETSSTVNSSITRSPEVRGRNLSDKTKDKDDILPIMQLYNTSNIFNGTEKDSSDPSNTATGTEIQPPTVSDDSKSEELADDSETIKTTTNDSAIGQGLPSEKNNESPKEDSRNSRKNNKHGLDRDYTNSNASSTRSNVTSQENSTHSNRTRHRPSYHQTPPTEFLGYRPEFNRSYFEPGLIPVGPHESINVSEVITKRHDGDTIATQETVAVVSYILATLVVFPIAVGVGLILRRLIIRNRKVLEESDTSSEISCRKDALNLENGDFKTSIEKAITKLPRIQHLCHEVEKPPPPASQESRWEFPRDKLRLQTVLGQGNFGQVWKAEADDLTGHQGTTRLVAVKTVKEGASAREKEDLVRELEIMQQLGNHPNVVTLLGCCTEEEPHYLILEYVMYGKLLAYLRDHRTRQDFYNFSEDSAALTSRDLTVFGYCVARGMEYLASKKIIHRDLAARNVLVDHNKLCKIADFGMSRFANEDGEVIEARHGRNALPIRWMAPESLIYSLFTTKTDVWSFGILMWEIVTLGSTPYPDMAAREVMRNVQNGYRLERPSHCRGELFRVISRCWHADPDRRPEFQTLRREMAQLLEDSMNGHYVDLESFASECTD